MQIADHLMHEGFYPKAAAIYKKILKIKPDEESVQLNLGEISAKQGLLADAKAYFLAIANKRRGARRSRRRRRDDRAPRLAGSQRLRGARRSRRARWRRTATPSPRRCSTARCTPTCSRRGAGREALAALREAVRHNPDDVEGRGGAGARRRSPTGTSTAPRPISIARSPATIPALLMALMEIELRAGAMDSAREILAQLLHIDDVAAQRRSSSSRGRSRRRRPKAAFVCIDTAVDAELAGRQLHGRRGDPAGVRHPRVRADRRAAEARRDLRGRRPRSDDVRGAGDAGRRLSRGAGRAAEARVIAEDLVAREPWEHAHIERFRRALVMLDVPDPDTLIADRLSGQGPFVATDPFMAPESFGDPTTAPPRRHRGRAGAGAPTSRRPSRRAGAELPESRARARARAAAAPEARRRAAGPRIGARHPAASARRRTPRRRNRRRRRAGLDIDLTDVLAELQGMASAPTPERAKPAAPPPASLDDAFQDFRSEVSQQSRHPRGGGAPGARARPTSRWA